MWGGPAVGDDCTICGAPVVRDEMEFEIEFARGGDGLGPEKHHLHIRCFEAWELERDDIALAAEGISSTDERDRRPRPSGAAAARSQSR